jgi:hypothetical protein
LSVELLYERNDEARLKKVDEAVPHVTLVLEIDRQVEEIVRSFMSHVHLVKQHHLVVLVWNIPHHDSRTRLFAILQSFYIQSELLVDICAGHIARR